MAIATGTWLLVAGTVVAAVSLTRNTRLLRAGLAAAAALAFAAAIGRHRYLLGGVAAAVLLINLMHLLVALLVERRVTLRDEESRMAERALPGMSRQAVRSLIDQGLWIDGRDGETLIREGEPVSHLFWLSEGEARVTSAGRPVATGFADQFLGEITVLAGSPATATVSLASQARFWCVGADALRSFLAANPTFRPALESAFAGSVAEKLRQANERLARR